METILAPLPLGTSDFSALRKSGQIYVDKTRLIYTLASKRQIFSFETQTLWKIPAAIYIRIPLQIWIKGLSWPRNRILMERRKYLSSHTIGFLESERLFLRRRI